MESRKQPHEYKTYTRSRSVRLPAEAYVIPDTCYFVTACCLNRVRYFENRDTAKATFEIWLDSLVAYGYRVFALCLMPDHLHVLMRSGDAGKPLGRAVGSAKAQALHRVGKGHLLWQAKYHDHVLWLGEDVGEVARYIAENPVRAGLVECWEQWPWTYVDEVLL